MDAFDGRIVDVLSGRSGLVTLADLINDMHNSIHQLCQVTRSGEIIEENKFYVLGFVPADAVGLRKEEWFRKLTNGQIDSVDKFLGASMLSKTKEWLFVNKNSSCRNQENQTSLQDFPLD